jgi:hypothetical protein
MILQIDFKTSMNSTKDVMRRKTFPQKIKFISSIGWKEFNRDFAIHKMVHYFVIVREISPDIFIEAVSVKYIETKKCS